MGLAAAYHLLKAGHKVEVFEADAVPGGMAAHFDFGGVSLERYYHFVCKADQATFSLLQELGLEGALRWRRTSMGYFYQGRHYAWGDPIALLRFPHLDIISKIRYGLMMFTSTKRSDWSKLDRLRADQWIKAWCGERGWKVLWEKLFALKFFEFADDISAAWIWTRFKRVGTSRRSLMQEEMGYIEGGSEVLIKRLVERVLGMGGTIHLASPVSEIHLENEAVSGVTVSGTRLSFDSVITTVPLPHIPKMIPALPEDMRAQYAALKNVGVVCVVHKLKKPVSRHFWLNINDDRIEIPGIIEFSNLRHFGSNHIVFVPYYLPITHPRFSQSDDSLIRESFGYLKLLNPELLDQDRVATQISRLRFAQPICPPRYLERIPPVATRIRGLQIADTSSYYPEDRGISEGVRLAREIAGRVQ